MMENSLVYNTQTLGSMSKSDPFAGALIPPDHHHMAGNTVSMVQNHNSAGSKLKLQLSAPLTHSLVMSTKQQVLSTHAWIVSKFKPKITSIRGYKLISLFFFLDFLPHTTSDMLQIYFEYPHSMSITISIFVYET